MASYFLPAMYVEFSILSWQHSLGLSLRTLIDVEERLPDGMALAGTELAGLFDTDGIVESVRGRIIFSAVAYFVTFAVLVAAVVLTVLDKGARTCFTMLMCALVLYIAGAYAAVGIPQLINEAIAEAAASLLGFFALFFDFSNAVAVSIGRGFWVTLVALVGLVLCSAAVSFGKYSRRI